MGVIDGAGRSVGIGVRTGRRPRVAAALATGVVVVGLVLVGAPGGGTVGAATPSVTAAPGYEGTLYVGNLDGSNIPEFTLPNTGNVAPDTTVTGTGSTIDYQYGNTVDSAGDLWATNFSGDTVTEYTPAQLKSGGSVVPHRTISSSDLDGPVGLAFDGSGNLWVANYNGDTLIEFSAAQVASGGDVSPVVTLGGSSTGLDGPEDLAFAGNGDLWVANSATDDIEAFNPGSLAAGGDQDPQSIVDATGGSLSYPAGLAFDTAGNLWVANAEGTTVVSFTPTQLAHGAAIAPNVTLSSDGSSSLDDPWGLAFDGAGNLWVANEESPGGGGSVVEFTPVQRAVTYDPVPMSTIVGTDTGLDDPAALAFAPAPPPNYLLIGSDGGTFAFGAVNFEGSLPGLGVHVNDIVGAVPTTDGKGYLMIGSDGGTFAFGDANFEGSLPGLGVHVHDIVAVVPSSDDRGYLMIGSDGGIFAFGDATFEGSLPGLGVHVDDVVGAVPTTDGKGYLMIGSDGGTFAFGDANFEGSLPGLGVHVHDVVGVVPTPNDKGYLMIGSDGGTFAFGDANFEGSLPGYGIHVSDIVAVLPTYNDKGYVMIGADGATYSFGNSINLGSLPGLGVNVTDIASAIST